MSNYLNFIVWSLGVFGTSFIITFSTIFKPVRDKLSKVPMLGKLLSCILCMSFWSGVFWGKMLWSPAVLVAGQDYNLILECLFNGCVGSSIGWLIFLAIKERMVGL